MKRILLILMIPLLLLLLIITIIFGNGINVIEVRAMLLTAITGNNKYIRILNEEYL